MQQPSRLRSDDAAGAIPPAQGLEPRRQPRREGDSVSIGPNADAAGVGYGLFLMKPQ